MMLVPTLEKVVGAIVTEDFWANHLINQNELDRQGEPTFWGAHRIRTKDERTPPLERLLPNLREMADQAEREEKAMRECCMSAACKKVFQ